MAQTGFTPIVLYNSGTTTNAPIAADLTAGELGLNYKDGLLFYKDDANAIQKIGYKLTPIAAGGTGAITAQLAINALVGSVTNGYLVQGNGTNIVLATAPTFNQDTTGKSAKTDALNSATTVVNVSSATAPTNGQVLTASSGTAATWVTPASGVSLSGTNTWTGGQTFTNSLMKLLGSSTGVTTFTSANTSATAYTITFPAATDTLVNLNSAQTLTNKTLSSPIVDLLVAASTSSNIQIGSTIQTAEVTIGGGVTTGGVVLGSGNASSHIFLESPTKVNEGGTYYTVGFREVPQNSQSAAYTCVLADSGKHILHPSADTTARTFTVPANSSVAYPIGTAITFVNQNAGGVVTIAITTDTMRLAGAGTTGSRTLAANGVATALKLTSTEWIISGTGLT